MSIIDEIIDAVIDMAEAALPADHLPIGRGPLTELSGVAIEPEPSAAPIVHMDRRNVAQISVILNGKHADRLHVSGQLMAIHQALTTSESYPCTDRWQIADVRTQALPALIGVEADHQWLYGSALTITIYY